MALCFSLLAAGCGAAMPESDAHPARKDAPVAPSRGFRLEPDHMGEWIAVPTPGKITVVDFWASYCEPCINSMPRFEGIWTSVDRSKVQIVGVSIDEEEIQARKTMAERFPVQVTFPMVFDGRAARLQGLFQMGGAIPATFVIDRRGVVRFFFDGSDGDFERLEQAIRGLAEN